MSIKQKMKLNIYQKSTKKMMIQKDLEEKYISI